MSESFKHSLFNCGDCGTCLAAFCCTPCLHGRTASRLDTYPSPPSSSTDYFNTSCFLSCLAISFSVGCIPTWIQRAEMRKRFGIEGNACGDCMATCCCLPCAQAQLEVEVKERGEDHRLLGSSGQAYGRQTQGMVYAPQHSQQQVQQGFSPSPAPQYHQDAINGQQMKA